ncbi:MAG: DNA polymerase III subunit delta' [Firmicutes bacterium]|nr:DNA polymerase III subunit delta' [Bacillota bacterium]
MGFEKIVGQEPVLESLKKTIKGGEISHAYLFSGPAGSGKKTLAFLFAQALNCSGKDKNPCQQCLSCRKILSGNHPDLYVLKPQGTSLKIGQLREIKENLYFLPMEGRKKVCIIHDAELMTLPAANSLLKILEEPPKDLVFIILTARLWDLLPTIVSRCARYTLTPLTGEKMGQILGRHDFVAPEEKEIIIALAGGNPGKGLEMALQGDWRKKYNEAVSLLKSIESGPAEDVLHKAEEYARKEDLQEILDLWLLIYRNRLFLKLGGPETFAHNFVQWSNGAGMANCEAGTIERVEEQKSSLFLEKICRAIIQLKKELYYNINSRLALEALFLKMRGVV